MTMKTDASVTAMFTPVGKPVEIGRFLVPFRGLWTQFERRGWASEYWPGQVIQDFSTFDSVVGGTVKDEVALQLDKMREMGVNAITIELRTADPVFISGGFVPPGCNIPPVLGFRWPQPTQTELANLPVFLDLVRQKGMRVILGFTDTHMEEQPPTNSQAWLGAILNIVKNHPAVNLVLFNGTTHLVDTDGNGTGDACGVPAEPPLWLGPASAPANYVRWAIGYALSLGIPSRKLSAEAVVGDFFLDSQPAAGPDATDRHLWSPIVVLKKIFDDLGIPDRERTYALSFYEHFKCSTARNLPCGPDVEPHTWADQTLQAVLATVGKGNGARIVAGEMGVLPPVTSAWPAERALESLVALMEKHGVDGGGYWHWVNIDNAEDLDPGKADAVKRRGTQFVYNPVQKEVMDMGGFHLVAIPNGSFESDANLDTVPDEWTIDGSGTANRYFLAGEAGQPVVPSRGQNVLRLTTGNGADARIIASSAILEASPNTAYTTTANLRFAWSGDSTSGSCSATRPHVFVTIRYLKSDGLPSGIRDQDLFPLCQEHSAPGFQTFPFQYTTPSDATSVRIVLGATRNGFSAPITFDVDHLR